MNTKKCIFFPRFLVTLTAMLALTLCMAGQADAAYSWNGEAETGLVKFWEKDEDGHGVYGLKDANGSIVVPAIYLDIKYAGPGRLIVCCYGEYDPKIWQCPYLHGVVDYAGNVLYPYTESPIYYCKEIDTIAVPNDGCTVLLNRDLREYDRISYQSVRTELIAAPTADMKSSRGTECTRPERALSCPWRIEVWAVVPFPCPLRAPRPKKSCCFRCPAGTA